MSQEGPRPPRPIPLKDRASFAWVARGRIDVENGAFVVVDESGIRTSKTVNGVTTYFTTKDGGILSPTDGTNTMYFQYDNSGNPAGFLYNGTQYFYLTNQMGDVIGITDNAGTLIATYTYGAWGEVLAVTPATAGNATQLSIANANPLHRPTL